jgi:threonine/homoserine/homoserine lactone efflux protein
MDLPLFLRGLAIGFAIAAPVGPIGLLCIRRAVAGGFAQGFATGLGAAAADAVYGAVAAFGLTAVSGFLLAQQGWLRLAGGAALIWLGLGIALKNPPGAAAAESQAPRLWPAFAQTFALTLANPATVLSFLAVFAGLGLGAVPSALGAVQVVLGVFLGSALWWLFLAGLSAAVRRQFKPATLAWINRAAGLGIAGFGLAAALSFFYL